MEMLSNTRVRLTLIQKYTVLSKLSSSPGYLLTQYQNAQTSQGSAPTMREQLDLTGTDASKFLTTV
jgi:hypothetical protein